MEGKCKHCYDTQFSGVPICELNQSPCVEEIEEGKCPFKDLNGNVRKDDVRVDEFVSSCEVCDFGNGVEMLYEQHDGIDIFACLIQPTPISIRKNPTKPASIKISIGRRDIDIPISHCPCCGRKL